MWIKSIGNGRGTFSDLFETVGISKPFNVQSPPRDAPAGNYRVSLQSSLIERINHYSEIDFLSARVSFLDHDVKLFLLLLVKNLSSILPYRVLVLMTNL